MSVKVKVFTQGQLNYIADNILYESALNIARKLNMDSNEFIFRLQLITDSGYFSEDLKGATYRELLKAERIRVAKQHDGKVSSEELGELIGYHHLTARTFAKENDIKLTDDIKKRTAHAEFSEGDIDLINHNFIKMSIEELTNLLTGFTVDQVSYKVKEMIKEGRFGEDNKNENLNKTRFNMRVEILKDLEDREYHREDVQKMFDCGSNTAKTLADAAGLKLYNKIRTVSENRASSEEFYTIPTDDIDLNTLTYEDWFRRWFHTYRDTGIREVTRLNYFITWTVVREEVLGKMLLKNINRNHVQAYVNDYGATRSKNTVLDHIQLIRSAFKDAQLDGHIRVNPAGNVRMAFKEQTLTMMQQKTLRETKKWLEVDEYEKLKNYLVKKSEKLLSGEPVRVSESGRTKGVLLQTHIVALLVLLKTGARYSEVMGLTRSDVISDSPLRINIDKTWDHKKLDGHTFVPTKNISSIREVNIDIETVNIISKYTDFLDRHNLETLEDTLFNLTGKDIYNSEINKTLTNILEELKITRISVHKLRHTMASYLIAKGVDLMVVAKRLGHTDSSMVMKVYGHLLKETEDKHNEKIMQLL